MKIQIRSLAIALAIAVPLALAATAKSSAAPINGTSIKADTPAVTLDVRYQVRRAHPHASYRGYPAYSSYWGYPAYRSDWDYPTYDSYYGADGYGYSTSGCLPSPRVAAYATAPWTDTPTCPSY
ncbi:hypothetical protein [Bradyrhizobium nanningense]|uniref:hypothetical protein n=1 Tax=Bradyrhizobium nanningense TaxID=1325118 RepID=UPI001008A55C|nr:hypothetical protein [Bradyrhizobium nanningense]